MATTWRTADEALARMVDAGESQNAHSALLDYIFMPPHERSLRLLCEKYMQQRREGHVEPPTVRIATLEEWSRRYFWQARLDVVLAEERARRIQAEQEQIEAMHQRHIQMAQALQAKALLWLKEEENKLYKPADVLAFLKVATAMERQARGLPAQLMELTMLSNDELLNRYSSLLDSLRGLPAPSEPIDVTPEDDSDAAA